MLNLNINHIKQLKRIIPQNVKYPAKKVNSITWDIFSQEDIKLQPKEVKQLKLGLGFMMSEGIVLAGLANSLREKRCSIQNEVNLENTNDIITTISNNSKEIVNIQENELLCLVCYKKIMITIKKMTEMKEKIYPTLPTIRESPTAPDIELTEMGNDQGHTYRLKVISDVQKFLEEEISKREAFSKKYFRVARIVSNIDSVLITITLGSGIAGAVLLSTVVAAPIVLGLEIGAATTGLISLIGNNVVKKTTIKAEKHLKIKMLASAKLDTIASHISKAMMDNYISDEEFKLIMEELNKYKAMKEEIRNNTKKKLKTEEEESLIEKGRQEARESFRKLVEKNKTLSL